MFWENGIYFCVQYFVGMSAQATVLQYCPIQTFKFDIEQIEPKKEHNSSNVFFFCLNLFDLNVTVL